jgi:hypothetical protein
MSASLDKTATLRMVASEQLVPTSPVKSGKMCKYEYNVQIVPIIASKKATGKILANVHL